MSNESSLSPDGRRDAPHEIERERLNPQIEFGRSLFAVECVAITDGGTGALDGTTPDRVQRGVLEALEPRMTLVFEFSSVAVAGGIPSWYVGAFADSSRPLQHDHAARAAILAAIEDPRAGFTFQQVVAQRASGRAKFSMSLRPALECLDRAHDRRMIGFGPQCIGGPVVRIPRMPPLRGGEMDALLAVLANADAPVRVRCTLRRVAVPLALVRRVLPDRKRLSSGGVSWLEAAADNPTTIQLDATILSDEPIDPDLAARAGHCLFGTSPRSGHPESGGTDDHLSGFHEDLWVPTLLPSPQSLSARGLPTRMIPGALTLSDRGVVLGRLPGSPGRLVRLPDEDRRNCYVIGGSGSGKSTLLLKMLEADMRAGGGVCLIDPHGDLYEEAIRRIPASRVQDVILIDPYDEERTVGLNMLESCSSRPDISPTLVSNSLIAIFDRLYDLDKTGGPVFESYFRNAVLLVLASDLSATIVDVIRVFEDASYRQCLLDLCPDRSVTNFWTEQAQKAGGDASLRNVAPYVTSKLNQFTSNHLIRPIVSQSTSTVRFDSVLRDRQIVLVNLAIGQLGALDSRFLGMLLLDKIFEAAVSFVGARRSNRQPFTIYIDEFHDFAGSRLETMLSAGRKFGLQLVLAHQTLSQLTSSRYGSRLIDAVMSNTGTKLVFRIGGHDVDVMSRELGPNVSAQQLQTLADFNVVATLFSGGRRGLPFVFETLPLYEPEGAVAAHAELLRMMSRYSTPTQKADLTSAVLSRNGRNG